MRNTMTMLIHPGFTDTGHQGVSAEREPSLASTLAWSTAGVGALYLMGKAIGAAGTQMHLEYACWQLTGARAAASTLVLSSLFTMRRGNVAFFGALYALVLVATHDMTRGIGDWTLPMTSAMAGLTAWLVQRAFAQEAAPLLTLLVTTLAFNFLMTFSSLITTMTADVYARTGILNWSTGNGIRALATVIVVALFALSGKVKPR